MSGVDIISLVSSVISIIDAAVKIANACNDVYGLPEAMREARVRLPLVAKTLNQVRSGLKLSEDDVKGSCTAMTGVLMSCEQRAAALEKIFRTLIPSDASRPSARKRFTTAAMMTFHMGKSRKVEPLMKGILEDIQLMADSRALESFDQDIQKQIRAAAHAALAMDLLSRPVSRRQSTRYSWDDRPPSLESSSTSSSPEIPTTPSPPPSSVHYYSQENRGSGMQCIHAGTGVQNNYTGHGVFFSGPVSGPFHVTTTAR
ncbi:hypothetical protein QBC32DRAFT_85526 [Pseudoneurospora amorphoporcata]|uniref:NACHT-NTPase and P-loop NTPases N-terminal domain-containing protein n=1 Tax=Pseudoneurospora amorphoporcata TaxID=241081 RepID=A0AAN6SBU1_9PEZI|nr:hypothetical protein QBC32DRAFT_85526 [Pseudoneurospora amorphoporcata]